MAMSDLERVTPPLPPASERMAPAAAEVVNGDAAPPPALRGEAEKMTVADLLAHKNLIIDAASQAMKEGHHYGKIEGVSKPTLAKPGAELLLVMFRLGVDYD